MKAGVWLALTVQWMVGACIWNAAGASQAVPDPTSAAVTTANTEQPPEVQIAQRINSVVGDSGEVVSVQPLPNFPNLYEVLVNERGDKRILYSNGTGSYILLGSVVNTATLENITALRMTELNRIEFDRDLRPDLALITQRGDGSRQLAVFEDPRCTFCKALRQNAIEPLDNITVYTYVYPALGPASVGLAKAALCANDPDSAWHEWMLNNVPLIVDDSAGPTQVDDCKPPIDQLLGLGVRLGVKSTPTLIFEDGTRTQGELSMQSLQQRLDKASEWRAAQAAADQSAELDPPAVTIE